VKVLVLFVTREHWSLAMKSAALQESTQTLGGFQTSNASHQGAVRGPSRKKVVKSKLGNGFERVPVSEEREQLKSRLLNKVKRGSSQEGVSGERDAGVTAEKSRSIQPKAVALPAARLSSPSISQDIHLTFSSRVSSVKARTEGGKDGNEGGAQKNWDDLPNLRSDGTMTLEDEDDEDEVCVLTLCDDGLVEDAEYERERERERELKRERKERERREREEKKAYFAFSRIAAGNPPCDLKGSVASAESPGTSMSGCLLGHGAGGSARSKAWARRRAGMRTGPDFGGHACALSAETLSMKDNNDTCVPSAADVLSTLHFRGGGGRGEEGRHSAVCVLIDGMEAPHAEKRPLVSTAYDGAKKKIQRVLLFAVT
jgi:hypothetical protein